MNSLDIILYLLGAGALFLLLVAGYSIGYKDGKREGYTRGRAIARGNRIANLALLAVENEQRKQVTK